MAKDLQDTILLARISGGDLTAIDTKYHLSCLTSLRNRHRSFLRESQSNIDDGEQSKNEVRASMELVTHIENFIENGIFCFTFCSLHQMYEGHLQILGIGKEINKIRFKECVLRYFPNAQEQNDGKRAILVFE